MENVIKERRWWKILGTLDFLVTYLTFLLEGTRSPGPVVMVGDFSREGVSSVPT